MSLSPEEEQLLLTIRAAPDDDAPRLVYADYLLEQGDLFGELIALQCALANAPDKETRFLHLPRERELFEKLHWISKIIRMLGNLPPDLMFARGFLIGGSLDLAARDFLKFPDTFFRAAPHAKQINLRGIVDPQELVQLSRCAALRRYPAISLSTGGTLAAPTFWREALFQLCNAEALATVENLELYSFGRLGIESICQSTRLKLATYRFTYEMIESDIFPLLHCDALRQVSAISMNEPMLAAPLISELSRSPSHQACLRTLHLTSYAGQAMVTDADCHLLASIPWKQLTELWIHTNQVTLVGTTAICSIPTLQRLHISTHHLSEDAITQLKARFGENLNAA